ncbi:MAG: hypothetical protein EPN39_01350 [Chitinophagaceae bacterium]|jgi:soluble P-type ATPase|nr:MAG: hypothetical protein EPN39_01350 [Chitinophagaceae bacterium]
MDWINSAINPLRDLISFLHKKTETNDVQKRQIIRELRNNLMVFENAFINNIPADTVIDNLSNESIREAIKVNFHFDKIKPGKIIVEHILDDRNKKYTGWTAGRLLDKIDEKIEELKTIKRLNGNTDKAKNNISLMLSNLYFRMKLLAEFIRS